MRKAIFFVVLIALFIAAPLFAEEAGEQEMGGKMKQGKMDMMRKCGMMMKKMDKEMVATKDGGVIVMTGHKLMKYDKNLELVKEVKIKTGKEGMYKKMMEKKGKCPMCRGAMGETEGTPSD